MLGKPYDTLVWGEVGAKDGLTGTAFLAGQNHTKDGDKFLALQTNPPPWLMGLGSLSDTKPSACALVPDSLEAQQPINGPGGIDFWNDGWARHLREAPIMLEKGDKYTGQCSSTNVNEGSIIGADIVYGSPVAPWKLKDIQSQYTRIFNDIFTITSGADVTFDSGSVTLDAAASNYAKWSDTNGKFDILGVLNLIGAATFGGIAHLKNFGGDWHGHQPGLIVNPLSAVTFNTGAQFAPALQPIPFEGDALPSIGMTATSAGAIAFGLVIGKV